MWSGQPPGNGRNTHGQNPYQQPTGHRPPGGGNRAKVVAVAAATIVVAVVLSCFLLLNGARGDHADDAGGKNKSPTSAGSSSKSATTPAPVSPTPHSTGTERPTVPGWKVVVNPKRGTAFDVPPDWNVKPQDMLIGFDDDTLDYSDPDNWGKTIILMGGTATLGEDRCLSDDDKDGRMDSTAQAIVGTKGAKGSKNTEEVALTVAGLWVYGGYTQPDTKSIVRDRTAQPYTTRSGVRGSIAWARSRNTPQKGRCATDGKAITFGFKNSAGGFVAWSLVCDTGVKDELPDSTIMRILSTVRLHGKPTES